MSFGFSVGDILAVSTLARNVWGRFRDSSDQFDAIQSEVAGLYLALHDIAKNFPKLEATDEQSKDFPILLKGCRDVLEDAERYIQKNESLGIESSGLAFKTHKAWRKAKWDSAAVSELRDRMVANATNLYGFNTSLASQKSRETSDKVSVIAEDIQVLTLNQIQQERDAVLEWISPLKFAPQQSDLSARRQEGTGSWLLESQEFQGWKSKKGQTLVCQGMPGAGKTMLTSLVIDDLWQSPSKENVAIAYIYCDYRRQDDQTPINLTASVAKQLLECQVSVPETVLTMYKQHHSKGTRPSFEEFLEMIRYSLAQSSWEYIILDALDELGNAGHVRQTLIERLRSLQDVHHFNLMTTSRYIPSLALEFYQPTFIDIRASPEDIRRYVEGHILDLPNCVRKSTELQEAVANAIVSCADGMFLLAQLHLDSLRDKTSTKLTKKALGVLPKGSDGLDQAYNSAMQRVENQREGFRLLATQLLGWLTYSERLMSVQEVQHALAIEPGTPNFDEDNLGDIDEIVGFCAGLVIVDEETQIIRLVHYTTQEYFRRNGRRQLASAQQDIAISCLTYLLYDSFGNGWAELEIGSGFMKPVKNRLLMYPFLNYAARFWAAHASACRQPNVKELILRFAKDDRKVSSAGQVILSQDPTDECHIINKFETRGPFSAMHILAYLGHAEIISELLDHGFEADVFDCARRTPLWWAARRGCQAVVELLMSQNHVDVNNRGLVLNPRGKQVYSSTALDVASEFGHDRTVNILIEREDVDVNLPSDYGNSPLHIAVQGQRNTVVELLLTRSDIDVNSRDDCGRTPLAYAAGYGHEEIVVLLLRHNHVQVNSVDHDKFSPLVKAARSGHKGIVKMLLDRPNIKVNRRDGNGQTALHHSVSPGQASTARLLLSHKTVDVNMVDMYGNTALHKAAMYNMISIVKLLLECPDIDPNLTDKRGRTPLHYALKNRRETSVRLLLEHVNIKVNLKDYEGITPLAQAMTSRRIAIVKLLCARPDIDLETTDNEGRDLLTLATEEQERISKLGVEGGVERIRELETCLGILRSAIDMRSRNRPLLSQSEPS